MSKFLYFCYYLPNLLDFCNYLKSVKIKEL